MVGKLKGDLMATIKEVYELLKKKQAAGEKIGMFGESFIEAVDYEQETSTTKEVNVSFIQNKSSYSGDSAR